MWSCDILLHLWCSINVSHINVLSHAFQALYRMTESNPKFIISTMICVLHLLLSMSPSKINAWLGFSHHIAASEIVISWETRYIIKMKRSNLIGTKSHQVIHPAAKDSFFAKVCCDQIMLFNTVPVLCKFLQCWHQGKILVVTLDSNQWMSLPENITIHRAFTKMNTVLFIHFQCLK